MAATPHLHNLPSETLTSTGPGLGGVLAGGVTPNRLYRLEGVPEFGKTTLAVQRREEVLHGMELPLHA